MPDIVLTPGALVFPVLARNNTRTAAATSSTRRPDVHLPLTGELAMQLDRVHQPSLQPRRRSTRAPGAVLPPITGICPVTGLVVCHRDGCRHYVAGTCAHPDAPPRRQQRRAVR